MNTLVVCPKCEKMNRVALEKAETASPVCGSCKASLPVHGGVQDISGTALSKLVRAADRPIVVDFWAEWCGPVLARQVIAVQELVVQTVQMCGA